MRRFLRVRILFVLIALLLVPALALPYAERLRTEWARYWQPEAETEAEPQVAGPFVCGFDSYSCPDLTPIARQFGAAPDGSNDVTVFADFPILEEAAQQERFLREMEAIELPDFDEFEQGPLLSLPTEEYWAELKAREERRRKAAAP